MDTWGSTHVISVCSNKKKNAYWHKEEQQLHTGDVE